MLPAVRQQRPEPGAGDVLWLPDKDTMAVALGEHGPVRCPHQVPEIHPETLGQTAGHGVQAHEVIEHHERHGHGVEVEFLGHRDLVGFVPHQDVKRTIPEGAADDPDIAQPFPAGLERIRGHVQLALAGDALGDQRVAPVRAGLRMQLLASLLEQ